ncbi:MAG: MFS transporter [Promethearchaeota archaeon]
MNENIRTGKLPRFILFEAIIIGIVFAADSVYGFVEQNFFNTYLAHVLQLSELYVSVMVSFSATMGLIFLLVWGIFSDNTRSKYGRRRPYILIGGLISGTAAILYGYSPNYFWAFFIDVVILGISSNAFFAAERAVVPDTINLEYRGRANGIITAIGNIGVLIGVALFLISDLLFTVPAPSGEGKILTQGGHQFVLAFGGIMLIGASILGFIFIKEQPTSELPPKRKFKEDFARMFDYQAMKEHKEFFKMTLAYMIYQSGIGIIMPFLFIYIFSLGISTLQLLVAILIGFPLLIIITIMLGKISDRFGRKKYTPLIIIIISIGVASASFVKTDAGVNVLLFFISLPFILVALLGMVAPLSAWSQDLLPEDQRGKFFGILNIVFTVPQIIGAMIAGAIAEAFGLQWIFLASTAFFIISTIFFGFVKETYEIKGN